MATTPKSGKPHGPIDPAVIRELAHILTETDLTEIEVERGDLRVRVAREPAPQYLNANASYSAPAQAPPASVAPAGSPPETPAPMDAADLSAHPGSVPSPMVGTVYIGPEPGAAAFVKVGDSVNEGDTLLLIEAMKTYNPISAPKSGRVLEILVEDHQPVEFGEVLIILG